MTAALHMLDTDTASYVIKGRSAAVEAKLAAIPPIAYASRRSPELN